MKSYRKKYKGKSGQDQGQEKKLIHLKFHLNARDQYLHQRSNQKRQSKKKKIYLMLLDPRAANRNLLNQAKARRIYTLRSTRTQPIAISYKDRTRRIYTCWTRTQPIAIS